MIDKIKSILKKEEVSAPKELPELLFEQSQVDSSVQAQPQASLAKSVVYTPAPVEQIVSVAPTPVSVVESATPNSSQQVVTSEVVVKSEPQVKVEATANSMNFIDEDMELDDDLGEPSVKTQGVYIHPKEVVVSEPVVEIKPFIPVASQPSPKTFEVEIRHETPSVTPSETLVQEIPKPDVQINISGDNFFAKVENIINKDSDKLKELIEQDLFENLRVYHKKKEVGEKLYLHTSEVEDAIKEKLIHLKVIEDEWLIEKQKLEMQEKVFLNKEEELYSNIEELKALFSKIEMAKKLSVEVSDEQSFILVNGGKIRSLAGLSISLKSMSDEVFNYHVTVERNDFASWVSAVFSNDLGKIMSAKKDKAEMLTVLQL